MYQRGFHHAVNRIAMYQHAVGVVKALESDLTDTDLAGAFDVPVSTDEPQVRTHSMHCCVVLWLGVLCSCAFTQTVFFL